MYKVCSVYVRVYIYIFKLYSLCPLTQTALLVAVTANQPDIVHDLLTLGADVGVCDVKGQTALHLAATYGYPRIMQVTTGPWKSISVVVRIENKKKMVLKYESCF